MVGAGGAGFAAATEVVENGGTVIILEKNEYVGGNTARAGGTLNAPNPERQSKIGVEDSVQLFYENTMEAGDNKSVPELVEVLTENALSARQWLSDHGTVWTEKVYQTIGGLWPRSMDEKGNVVGVRAVDTKNGQEYIVKANNGVILATGGYSANNDMIENTMVFQIFKHPMLQQVLVMELT